MTFLFRLSAVFLASVLMTFAGSQVPLVFKDMRNLDGLVLFGSASQTGEENEVLELTPASFNQIGAVYTQEQVNIEAFHVSFRVRMSEESDGAPDCNGEVGGDGMAFIIQRGTELGELAGGLGFRGINNSVAVAIDTYCNANNNETGSNNITILTNGNTVHTAETPSVSFGTARELYIWLDYEGGTLFVRFNNVDDYPKNAQLQMALDIPEMMDGLTGHMGIVGATGGGVQKSELLNFTYHPPVPPLQFFKPDWLFVTNNGAFHVNFPQANPDGVIVPDNDRLGYLIEIERDDEFIAGTVIYPEQFQIRVNVPQITYPFDGAYQIRIARVFESNHKGARSADYVVDINPNLLATTPQSHLDYDRFLLHTPRRGSGFGTTVKFTNPYFQPLDVFLQAFNDRSEPLGAVVVTVPAGGTLYQSLYEDLFTASIQEVSHVAIRERTGFVKLDMEYRSQGTGYAAWTSEVDFRDGTQAGHYLEMDAAADGFLDGVAISNMRNAEAVEFWIVQYDRNTRQILGEFVQEPLAPGEKRALIVTSLFDQQPNAVYAFETRNPRRFLTAVGLSFNGFDFFSTKPMRAK